MEREQVVGVANTFKLFCVAMPETPPEHLCSSRLRLSPGARRRL
jgi:hypothetical protein